MYQSSVGKFISAITLAVVLLNPVSAFSVNATSAEIPDTLYIIPFLNVMVPSEVSLQLFDSFVDGMTRSDDAPAMKVMILKQDVDTVDKNWLARQHFITGEVFGYFEDSGCCSTELKAKARIYRYQPGSLDPVAEFTVPGEVFFSHDASTLVKERARLGSRIATGLADRLIGEFEPSR